MMTLYAYADEDKIIIAQDKVVTTVKPKEILETYQKNMSKILTPNSELNN